MDIEVRCVGAKKFEMSTRGHQVLADQPAANGGTDSAMTPPELFLSSLGACAAYYAAEYLRTRSLPVEELAIRVSGEKGDQPARFVSLRFEVRAPGLSDRHRDGILRAIDACFLKHTLNKPPAMEVSLVSEPRPVSA